VSANRRGPSCRPARRRRHPVPRRHDPAARRRLGDRRRDRGANRRRAGRRCERVCVRRSSTAAARLGRVHRVPNLIA
jgi:hypothetical protein